MISTVTPSDPFVETPTGVPVPQHLCWLYMTSGRMMQDVDVIDWEEVYWHLPLLTMDEKTGKSLPRWREEVKHSRLDDWWRGIAYQERFHELDLPVLHISGWYDDEQVGYSPQLYRDEHPGPDGVRPEAPEAGDGVPGPIR